MIKGSIKEEDITIVKIYASNILMLLNYGAGEESWEFESLELQGDPTSPS